MQLHFREYGTPGGSAQPLVFLHGLFGSSANWRGIVKRFEASHRILVPDLRNHGESPHDADVSYAAQSLDVVEMLDRADIPQALIIGHSMGGKVAMHLALQHAERVAGMVCVDIAPADYDLNRFGPVFEAMRAVEPETLESRQQADERLALYLPAKPLRSYLLQNLVKEDSHWHWRMNLSALEQGMPELSAFSCADGVPFPGDALFVYGGQSPYVKPDHLPIIRELFPFARLRQIADAGHWVYADNPQTFAEVLESFVEAREAS